MWRGPAKRGDAWGACACKMIGSGACGARVGRVWGWSGCMGDVMLGGRGMWFMGWVGWRRGWWWVGVKVAVAVVVLCVWG